MTHTPTPAAPEDCPPVGKLAAPRLQLRWESYSGRENYSWQCHYELVIPLGKHDIRAEQTGPRGGKRPALTELIVPIKGPSLRASAHTPCTGVDGSRYYDDPYRDGMHASWDAAVLGDLPIYVIAPDGTPFAKKDDDEKRARATGAQ